MKVIRFEQFGQPSEVLHVAEVPVPEPGPGEVLVRMIASPINPSDLLTVQGRYGVLPELPAVPGYEGVGVVEKAGPGLIGKLLVGRRVATLSQVGRNWAEYAVIPAIRTIPVSSSLPDAQVASFFVNPATVLAMARHVLRVPKGGWLLQSAAGSTLGRMMIKLGKHDGFRTINVVRRHEAMAELKALGADSVICSADGPIDEQVRKVVGGEGVSYAIDPVGGETGTGVFNALANGGRMLCYGTLEEAAIRVDPRKMIAGRRVVEEVVAAKDSAADLHRDEEAERGEEAADDGPGAVGAAHAREDAEADGDHDARADAEGARRAGIVLTARDGAARDGAEHGEQLKPYEPGKGVADVAAEVRDVEGAARLHVAPEVAGDDDEKEREHRAVNELRVPVLARTEEREGDMSPVELRDGEHVDHRDEKASPGAECDGGVHHGHVFADGRRKEVIERVDEHGLTELERVLGARERDRVRVVNAPGVERDREQHPGERTGRADVEEGATRRDMPSHPDHRAHRPERAQHRHRDEEGKRGVDLVDPRGDVVTHLVCDEDREHRADELGSRDDVVHSRVLERPADLTNRGDEIAEESLHFRHVVLVGLRLAELEHAREEDASDRREEEREVPRPGRALGAGYVRLGLGLLGHRRASRSAVARRAS